MIAAVIAGWVLVPWKILSSASTFLAFMGGYSVFLAPIAGILVADYWLVKKQHYDIPALYDPFGRYRFSGPLPGCNWRAFVGTSSTLLCVISIRLPSLPFLGRHECSSAYM